MSDPTDFRDRLAHVIRISGDKEYLYAYEMADTILAMPEMLEIHDALATLERLGGPGYLAYLDIPASVIAWCGNPTCWYPIPHRNAATHHCDCVCILRKGHEGRHFCAWESA